MDIDNSKIRRKQNNTNKTLCACVIEKKEKKKHEQTTDMNKTNKVRYTKKEKKQNGQVKENMTIVPIYIKTTNNEP